MQNRLATKHIDIRVKMAKMTFRLEQMSEMSVPRMPHNIEAEQALIGAIFLNNDAGRSLVAVMLGSLDGPA